jgi:hypothetical protein
MLGLALLNCSLIVFSLDSFLSACFGATFVALTCERVLLKFPDDALESERNVFLSSFPRTAAMLAA